MLYFLCLFLTLFVSFSYAEDSDEEEISVSTPEEVASLSAGDDFLIGGLISPLSGFPVLREIDLIDKGAQDVTLSRCYISPFSPCYFDHIPDKDRYLLKNHLKKNYKGWQCLPHYRIQVFRRNHAIVRIVEPSGMSLDFRVTRNAGPNGQFIGDSYGIHNTISGLPSGKHDLRNTKISILENQIIVYSPEGTVRHYRFHPPQYNYCYLDKEVLPNGKIIKYVCDGSGRLDRIQSMDPYERYIYASIRITHDKFHDYFETSAGIKTTYEYEKKIEELEWKEEKKIYGHRPKFHERAVFPYTLRSVSSPFFRDESLIYDHRFLLDTFFSKEKIFHCFHAPVPTPNEKIPHYRLKRLCLPVGENDKFVPVYELSYKLPIAGKRGGTTYVENNDGTSTTYHFSPQLLLTSIQFFGKDKKLIKEKSYHWQNNGWLKAFELKDGAGALLHRRSYDYDDFGNPRLETFEGDLMGNGELTAFPIQREYSKDGRHRLLNEKHDLGPTIVYTYLADTHLLTSKVTKEGDRILLREFFEYDDCYNLTKKVADDGTSPNKEDLSGVTQRTITEYLLRQTPPFLHMPEWIVEKYIDQGQEKLLKKVQLHYDKDGNVEQEDHFGADSQFAYHIKKQYYENRELASETNPLGQKAVYTCDRRGRRDSETPFSNTPKKEMAHDLKGRLKKLSEIGEQTHTTQYDYDDNDRCIKKIDYFGNITTHDYDPIANKVSQTHYPSIFGLEGQTQEVITQARFDAAGNEVSRTNADGHTTTVRYNAYGSPIEILHPSGAKETYRYYKNGKLQSYTDPDGLITEYEYDILGRITRKGFLSNNRLIAQEAFTYDSYHLRIATDKEDYITLYDYDKAGRKISEEREGRVTEFSYNALGQLSDVCKERTLFIHYEKDFLDRIKEETRSDSSKLLYKIAFDYDKAGNRSQITRYIHNQPETEEFQYDAFDRLIEHKDALKFVTTTHYDETSSILQTITTDPRQITTLKVFDVLGNLSKTTICDEKGHTLSTVESIYDPCGNRLEDRIHLYENGLFKKIQTHRYTYDEENQLSSLTRAWGTKDARTDLYTYFPSGKRKTRTLPDGRTLAYSYHPLGYLSSLQSFDGTIDHEFDYNLQGHLTLAKNSHITVERELDPFGNILKETVNHLTLSRTYDDFDRILTITLPDQSYIEYTYDPLFLRKISRNLFSLHFQDYDLDGNLLSETHAQHTYDPNGRKASIRSPYFTQECHYDPSGNLLHSVIDGQEQTYTYDGLSQLLSENGMQYAFDSNYNRILKNGQPELHNDLDEFLSCTYDLNGNIRHNAHNCIFSYDPLSQLIAAEGENIRATFAYDPLGRRFSKTVSTPSTQYSQYYLYTGNQELGAFTANGQTQQLRIPGRPLSTVSVELEDRHFATINDFQGNIRRLIDPITQKVFPYNFTAFGEGLTNQPADIPFNPWTFAGKRFDPEFSLIYFGKRYYDPRLGRWLTIDPVGCVDSFNLYQYVLNNPFKYNDPEGESLGGYLLGLGEIALGGILMISGGIIEIGSFGALTVGFVFAETTGVALIGHGLSLTTTHANDLKASNVSWKNTDVYAPDRPLPRDPRTKEPVPETDASHTELGTKKGTKGKYPQAREFDAQGRPVKDIDFTDHGRPQNHPNPHEHKWKPNPTGGTLQRSLEAEPLIK